MNAWRYRATYQDVGLGPFRRTWARTHEDPPAVRTMQEEVELELPAELRGLDLVRVHWMAGDELEGRRARVTIGGNLAGAVILKRVPLEEG